MGFPAGDESDAAAGAAGEGSDVNVNAGCLRSSGPSTSVLLGDQ